jgi:hypothetical protein
MKAGASNHLPLTIHCMSGRWRQYACFMLNQKLRERFYVVAANRRI